MAVRNAGSAGLITKYAAAGLCAILLAGCASSGKQAAAPGSKDYKQAIGVFTHPESDPTTLDPIAQAAFWGTRYDREPTSAEMGVRYSQALRKIGSSKEAAAVMSRVSQRHRDNVEVNLEYGKTLVETGRAFEAVRYFEEALEDRPSDWRTLSAYGVALDQIGEHEAARQQYDKALLFAPESLIVLNNKGLSFALQGDLSSAASVMRAAAASRRSDARIRQNYALVLALKGDMKEAERLARSDLPPQVADQNIQFFRTLMNQPAYWQDFAADSFDAPVFDSPAPLRAPAAPAAPKSAPKLKEEPKEERRDPSAPVALGAPVPVTSVSAPGQNAPDIK